MKYAADFRYIAREALRGKWLIAVVVGLVASLLGGAGADGPELKLEDRKSTRLNSSHQIISSKKAEGF